MTIDKYSRKIVFTEGFEPPAALSGAARAKTCCFTGHRPEKLPAGEELAQMNKKAAVFIRLLAQRGFGRFITGMSRGFDLEMARLVMQLGGSLICALPYPEQEREMRTEEEKKLYAAALENAELIMISSPHYTRGCYGVRNRLMVECSAALIGYAADRESRSGSMQTVRMAERAGLETYIMYGTQQISRCEIDFKEKR